MTLPTADPRTTTVGFVGLGVMGRPMARNLLTAGYALRVHNRSSGPVDALAELGATPTGSPAEAAEGADIVICMLPDSPDVEAVVLGEDGTAGAMRPGAVLLDMSTIAPETTRRLAAALAAEGVHAVDAPVSGGEQGAVDGTLTIMVGGEADAVAACRPLLDVLGARVTHVGGSGAGQVAKACNQVIVAGTIQVVAEALTLAARAGVDPAVVREALLGGFAASKVLDVHGGRILERRFRPGFTAALHHKDLGIALRTGADVGVPLPATALVEQLLGALVAQGAGHADHAALALLVEQLSGQPAAELRDPQA